MQNQLLYLIGIPGAGKTALLREVLGDVTFTKHEQPFAHCEYVKGGVQLGVPRSSGFGGTDALSMNVEPKVIPALRALGWKWVLGEGDRLASVKFFNAVRALASWQVRVLWLDTPLRVAAERRRQRSATVQDSSWVAGRITKVHRLARLLGVERLDGRAPLLELAAQLQNEPVIRALLGRG